MIDASHKWYAISFPQARFPFATPEPLVECIREIWEASNYAGDFCVFQEIDENYDTVIYFSPTAWRHCAPEVKKGYDGHSCEPPIKHRKPVVCVVGLYPDCQSLLET